MANLFITLAVTFAVLFFTNPLANARVRPQSLTQNDVITTDLPNALPDSEVHPIIRLPTKSDNPQSHSTELPEHPPQMETSTVESVPLRFARFRPLNRGFRLKWGLPSRPCHHRHDRQFPYNAHIVLPTGENDDFDPTMIRGGVRRIPPRWISLPHPHHRRHHDDNDEDEEKSQSVFKRGAEFGKKKLEKHFHHDDNDDDEKILNGKASAPLMHKRDKKDDGLLKRIRKMMDFYL